MNRRQTIVIASGLAALCAAQGAQFVLATPQGKWTITQIATISVKYPPKTKQAHFYFKGTPVRAAFNGTERVLTAGEVEGDAKMEGSNLTPQRIDFRGGVTGRDVRGSKVIELASKSAVLTGTSAQTNLELLSDVRIAQRDTQQGSSLVATGSKGTILGQGKAGATGTLEGPVHVKVNGSAKDGAPIDVDATCGQMNFDFQTVPYRVVMQGDVVVKGGQPGFQGETRASRMVLLLDQDYQPIEMQASGDPGTTTVNKGGNKH